MLWKEVFNRLRRRRKKKFWAILNGFFVPRNEHRHSVLEKENGARARMVVKRSQCGSFLDFSCQAVAVDWSEKLQATEMGRELSA